MSKTVEVSIIVPTLNEARNLPELLRRTDAALAGRAYEVIVVDDDSGDDTRAVCAELAMRYPLRLHVRTEPRNGLSGAVLDGMALARGEVLAVMDADLQHPPERLPDLIAPLERGQPDCGDDPASRDRKGADRPVAEEKAGTREKTGTGTVTSSGTPSIPGTGTASGCEGMSSRFNTPDAERSDAPDSRGELATGPKPAAPPPRAPIDFVIGSRYAPGGTTAEKWGPLRRLNSKLATILARPFAGHTLDPMSGFFALRRETYERAERLTPLGYKVGLELMCKGRVRNVAEIPIHFDARAHGESKLTLAQQFKYLEHLSRLYDFYYPRASPILKFLIATALGWLAGFGAYGLLLRAGASPAASPPLAYLAAVLTTAVFHLRYIRTQREFLLTPHPWRDFWITALAEWATCLLTARWLAMRTHGAHAGEVFAIAFGAATVMRYVFRKEFLQDIRGLRREEMQGARRA